MTFSKTVTLGCLATLAMAVSLPGWSAARFSPGDQPLGSIAPIVLSNSDLRGNTTKGYRPWFENGGWQGDLVEYTVTATGNLSTSVSFSQSSPTNNGDNWSALVKFADNEAADATYWDTGRKIITFNDVTQVPFRFTTAGIGEDNKTLLDPTAEDDASDILNFVRGERSNEHPAAGALRHRTSILGDIIHSKPVYVGAPNDTRTENGYAAWAADNSNRAPRVYVGANDGMLHVFDAANGNEVYAYVPSMLIGKLRALTARPYNHTYFVDGEISVRDAYFDNGDGTEAWRTVLAGSLGAGGKGFFALDITNPDLSSESAVPTGNDRKVLFEVSADGDDDLGDSFSRPVIAKLNDGDWYVVVGNGYNSVNGVAMLYLVNLDTLAVTRLSTGSGAPGSPNGLSSPSLLDTDRNGTADYAYAGDIDGNLWKFDLSSSNGWNVAYGGAPLHPTAGNQAITQAPQITSHPEYGYMVYFATGRLFTQADIQDTSVQSLYGIWDSGNTPPLAGAQSLLEQTWDGPKTYNYTDSDGSAATQTIGIYNPDAGDANWDTHHGWKVDFPAGGYRVLQPVQVRANRVKATVFKPTVDQPGENWLVEALLTDGGPNPANAPIYDLNVDTLLNDADLYNNAESGEPDWRVPMMWQQVDGIMSQVTIGVIANGTDTLFINFLQPSIVNAAPCTENCTNGFFNGHIDVQTYLSAGPNAEPPGAGVASTTHTHNYDKRVGRVYIDYFDINVPVDQGEPSDLRLGVVGQVEIDSTGDPVPASAIGEDEQFIVLVANADLSPGGTLQIGSKAWNVLDYQIQLHKALYDWQSPESDNFPVDDDGDPLVFTWGDIKAAGGTIRVSFNDRAILDGGLHPTQSECVLPNATGGIVEGREDTYDPVTKVGRWRNGALTLQLVKKSYFDAASERAISMVDIQKPDGDLVQELVTDDGTLLTTSIDYNDDGDIDDQYEQIGGLLARYDGQPNPNYEDAHLWESTLFWHFGELSRLTPLGRPCYGDENWAEAVALEQDNDAITAALALFLGEDVTPETLEAELTALEDCNTPECNAQYATIQAILGLSDEYSPNPDNDVDNDNPNDNPLVIDGGGTGAGLEGDGGDGAITQGNLHQPGRMSWTDVVK